MFTVVHNHILKKNVQALSIGIQTKPICWIITHGKQYDLRYTFYNQVFAL
jgi:hypothetical protein